MRDKVLVIGSGGREHALAWKLKKSKHVKEVLCAPGNGGTEELGTNIDIKVDDFDGIADLVKQEDVRLTVVGPEDPLVNGIVDYFWKQDLIEDGHLIFGPSAAAAKLEGSKMFAKDFMARHDIPTAKYEIVTNITDAGYFAGRFLRESGGAVIKASGLASGKGAIVCRSKSDIADAILKIMIRKEFKSAGDVVVVEEFMEGEEASILALTDGNTVRTLVSSQDHKAAYNGDKGPNTGGMGAYAPAPVVTDDVLEKVYSKILFPTIKGMREEGTPFTGCLYAGLMIKDGEPRVVEFNVRFGDPEIQPVISLLKNDLYELMIACCEGNLDEYKINNERGSACCVVEASRGYPGRYKKGRPIYGIEDAEKCPGVTVFHAGTKHDVINAGTPHAEEALVTNGGRVLGVTATANDLASAVDAAYCAADKITYMGRRHRTDIGRGGLTIDRMQR
jgi:phosphoribosylamine---glycine ligase